MLPIKFQDIFAFRFRRRREKIDFKNGGHGGYFGFPSGTILAIFFFIYKSPRCFLTSFKSIGLSFQKKRKIDLHDGGHESHLGLQIGMILANSACKKPQCFLLNFKSIRLSVQEKTRKINFKMAAMAAILDFRLDGF